MSLNEHKHISNPQILCSAIGDAKSDKTPLQVTQFESDIRIIEQLTELHLEGGGGGNGGESYNLLWYFAAEYTRTDALDKHNKKGYLFTIGDDKCHPYLSASEIQKIFSKKSKYTLSNEELVRMAQKKYIVFHIHIETDNPQSNNIFEDWRRLMPGQSTQIHISNIEYLSDLITAIISTDATGNVNTVLKEMNQETAEKISSSMAFIDLSEKEKNTITF